MIKYKNRIRKLDEADYKKAAELGSKWLFSQEYKDEFGINWKRADDESAVDPTYTNPSSYHSGTAGMIPWLLSMFELTGDKIYEEKAVQAGERLIKTKDLEITRNLGAHLKNTPWAIYGGLTGEASAATMLFEATKIQKFKDFALSVADEVFSTAKKSENGFFWCGKENYGLAGDSGTALFLIYISRHFGTKKYDEVIKGALDQVLSYAQKDKNGNFWWTGIAPERCGGGKDFYAPGIEFGTTGIAYVFAESYDYFKKSADGNDEKNEKSAEKYLEAAISGANHIKNLSVEEADKTNFLFLNTENKDVYYLGHCYGSMGICKLFYKLYKVTKDEIHKEWIERFVNGILYKNAPYQRSRGYWNNHNYCCGTTGLLNLFLALWAEFKDDDYLALAKDSANVLISNGFSDDRKGLRWYQNWTRVEPWNVYTYNGYIVGNAGDVANIAQLALALQGKFHVNRFIEEPFLEKI